MSTQDKPIHYEPHPVSPQRKAELIAKGVRIIDALYDPDPKTDKAEKPAQQAKQAKTTKQAPETEKPAQPGGEQPSAVAGQPEGEAQAAKE